MFLTALSLIYNFPSSEKSFARISHCIFQHHLTNKQFLMQKFYSALCIGKYPAIVKTFFITIFPLLFLSTTELKAQSGNHLDYDGIDDFTTLGNNVVQSLTGDYTIEFWVYWRGGSNFQRVFDFGTTGDPFTSPWIWFSPDVGGNLVRFAISTNGLGTPQTLDASMAFPQNTWTHVALVQTGTTLTMYINGTSVTSYNAITIHPSDLGSTTENWLGQSQFGGDPHFNGKIEEFRISNIARYTTNFTPPATEFTLDANTVALYHFNEGSGQTTADATGNFNAVLGASVAVESSDPTWVTASILPVKITSVSATLANNVVDIKWTASLDRETEFVIERSSNGSAFSTIGSINRSTGTNGFESFSFRDNKPLSGRSYYRLKCTEAGSPDVYSRMVAIVISAKEDYIVYPNPVKGNFVTVELPKAYTGTIEFALSSASGAVVFRQKENAVDKKEFQLSKTATIVPGVYVLEINTNGIKRSKTIIYQ